MKIIFVEKHSIFTISLEGYIQNTYLSVDSFVIGNRNKTREHLTLKAVALMEYNSLELNYFLDILHGKIKCMSNN